MKVDASFKCDVTSPSKKLDRTLLNPNQFISRYFCKRNFKLNKLVHFQDSRVVIEKFKSGFSPPSDIPFEDLSNGDTTSVNGSMSSMHQSINPILEKKTSLIGTITGGRIRKRSGLLGLFSNSKVQTLNLSA